MTSRTHEEIYEKIGALDARMDNVERSVEKIDGNVEKLTQAANMGKGAWWAAVKIGGFLVIMLSALAWLWGQIRPILEKWGG